MRTPVPTWRRACERPGGSHAAVAGQCTVPNETSSPHCPLAHTAQPAVGRRVLPPVAHFVDAETNRRRAVRRGKARKRQRALSRDSASLQSLDMRCAVCLAGPLLASKL